MYTFDVATGTPGVTLVPAAAAPDAGFGLSVVLDGDDALIGSPLLTSFSDGPDGPALLFDTTTASQTGVFARPTDERSLFGWVTALNTDSVLVGAPVGGSAFRGVVRVLDRATGALDFELVADDETNGIGFGLALVATDGVALVGAPFGSEEGARGGSAYVFDLDTGVQIAKLRRDTPEIGDDFGWAVALTDSYAIVSGPLVSTPTESERGAVYVFDLDTGVLLRELVPADATAGLRFGESLAVSGSVVLVGAGGGGPEADSGSAYAFDLDTGAELIKLVPTDADAGDGFGLSVALEGATAVVGAPGDDDNGADAGAVYTFDITPACSLSDLVAPFGVVDLGDLDAFIEAFLVAGALVDFVPPFGIVDLDDLDAFVVASLAGCP
ncbi:MAG: FG-GAP repeat protein [Planctomycetota bacterium]